MNWTYLALVTFDDFFLRENRKIATRSFDWVIIKFFNVETRYFLPQNMLNFVGMAAKRQKPFFLKSLTAFFMPLSNACVRFKFDLQKTFVMILKS